MPKGKPCFFAYQFFFCVEIPFFMHEKFSKNIFPKFFLKISFLQNCCSLTAAVQGGTFSFAVSIPFNALPMYCCCTMYQADPGSFCITLFRWSALTNTFQPKDSKTKAQEVHVAQVVNADGYSDSDCDG